MSFIDSHSHIDFKAFDTDRDAVMTRAKKLGVSDIIVSSTTAERWLLVKRVCCDYEGICHPAYGLHPMFMDIHEKENDYGIEQLKHWLTKNKAIAIGEIGLDFYNNDLSENAKKAQLEVFIAQLEIAQELALPVIIHARKSLDIVLKQLRRFSKVRGSIHSFSGSEQQARQLIDLGFYLSFGGSITYSRATRLHQLIRKLPLDAMLVETDSPDQPASSYYQQRNEPAYIIEVIKKIAELKLIDIDTVEKKTTSNAIELFKLKAS